MPINSIRDDRTELIFVEESAAVPELVFNSLTFTNSNSFDPWIRKFDENFNKVGLQGKKERNCGQRSVSLITGIPLDQVCSFLRKSKGTYVLDITGVLRWFGWDCGELTKCKQMEELPALCMLDCRCDRHGHFAVAYKGVLYDSGWGKSNIHAGLFDRRSRYRIRGFIEVFLPKSY